MKKLLLILLVSLFLSACTTASSPKDKPCPYLKSNKSCSSGCTKSCDKDKKYKAKSDCGGCSGKSSGEKSSCSSY